MARDPRLERRLNRRAADASSENAADKSASAGQQVRSSLRGKKAYEVRFVPVDIVEPHPENKFSMDEGKIIELAGSIERDGLLDPPIVWQTPEGITQMISGHRRLASWKYNREHVDVEKYATIPVRYRDDVKTHEQALVLLHVANFFTRDKTDAEKAASLTVLYKNAPELRKQDESLAGKRSAEIVAETLAQEGGEVVSPRQVSRFVSIDAKLSDGNKELWSNKILNTSQAESISKLEPHEQERFYEVACKFEEPITKDQFDALRAESVGVSLDSSKPRRKATGVKSDIHKEARARLNALKNKAKDLVELKEKGAEIDPEMVRVLKELVDKLVDDKGGDEKPAD